MGVELLTDRFKDQIAGVLGCWDRVLIFGTLPKICYAEGMTSYLDAKQVRIFDYPKFAELFRDRLRENAERLGGSTIWSNETGIDRNPAAAVEVKRPDDQRERIFRRRRSMG